MFDFSDEDILIDAIESALINCENVVKRSRDKYNFRCPICGDSAKNPRMRRGWFLKNRKGVWIFNCFNECGSMGAWICIKKYFPDVWKDYLKNVMRKEKKPVQERKILFKEIKQIQNPETTKKLPFKKITECDPSISELAIKYCKSRKIPSEIYSKFFICERGGPFNKDYESYKGRLIIPFYNKEGKIYYFIARSLYSQEPKYLCARGEKAIYNIHNVDKSKPIILVEGPLDCGFIENAIAITGLKIGEEQEKQNKDLNIYYLLDGDQPGRKKSLQFLKMGRWVFNWKKFLADNNLPEQSKYDINQVYIEMGRTENFTFKELEKYFVNNIYNMSQFI